MIEQEIPGYTITKKLGSGGMSAVYLAEQLSFGRHVALKILSPGMAETLDWAHALLALGTHSLNSQAVDDTLGVILKYQEDVDRVRGDIADTLVERAERGIPA